MKRLSVVIANFNYAQYVGRAVESALALDWDDLEVVVVDDGSTDGSLQMLQSFGERIRLIPSVNQGQREAVNLGFRHSTGDAVVFLDSDDLLPPGMPAVLDRALGSGVSKVQFQMQRIDEHDRPIGVPFPSYRRLPTPARLRHWMLATSAYPTPPASGNAYARWFLDRVMPLGPETGDFADSGLLAAAPLLGDVVAVGGTLVGYRRHGQNDSDLARSPDSFFRECHRALARWTFARRTAGLPANPSRVFRSREVLQFRAAAARTTPSVRLPRDSPARIVSDAIITVVIPGPESVLKRVVIGGWSLLVVVMPSRVATRLIAMRFGAARR